MVSRRKVAGALRFLLNANGLQVEYIRILHEALLVLVFMYGSETIWKEEKRSEVCWVLGEWIKYQNYKGSCVE